MSIVKSTLGLVCSELKPSELAFSRNSIGTRVNAIGLIETLPANTIRLDYKPDVIGETNGWLLEEASTNICLHSSEFENALWNNNGVVITPNNHQSPVGDMVNDRAAFVQGDQSAGSTLAFVKQTVGAYVPTSKYSISIYAKNGIVSGNLAKYLEITNKTSGSTFSQTFNLEDGTLGSATGTSTSKITEYPFGWYRCEVTFTADANSGDEVYFMVRKSDGNSVPETWGGQEGIFLWGAQVENKEYSTSYIPTTDATVTRAEDIASYTVSEEDWNWRHGLAMTMRGRTYGGSTSTPIFHYGNTVGVMGGSADDNTITYYNDGAIKVVKDGEVQTEVGQNTGLSVASHSDWQMALSVETDRLHAAQNTVLAPSLPDTTINVPMNLEGSKFIVKFFHGDGRGSGHLKNFKIHPNTLTDSELQSASHYFGTYNAEGLLNSGSSVLDGAITTAKLANDAVTGDKIADGAITSAHLGVDVIVAEDIADNAITVAEIQDGAVQTSKIADNAVTGEKISLASETTGDIMYYDGTNWIRLPKGNDGQLLSSSTANILEWKDDGSSAPANPDTQLGTNGGDITGTIAIPEILPNVVGIVELATDNAGTAGQALMKNASGNLEFGDVSADPTMGGDLSGVASNAQIVNSAVDSDQIANLAVVNAKLADDAVSAEKLRDSTVLDSDRAVTTNHIRNSAITADKIANDAVTSDKIADDAVLNAHLADNSVKAAQIENNAVTNSKINVNAVTSSKIATDAVTTAKIADGAITAGKIASGVIVAQDISANAVGINELNVSDGTNGQVLSTNGAGVLSFIDAGAADPAVGGDVTGTISNITIPDNTITSAMIAADVIVASDLADNAIGIAEIQDGAVVTSKLADNAVNGSKISMGSDATGDILFYNGTDYTRLPVGTSGQVLTMNSGGTAPEWAATSSNASSTNVGGDLSGTVANAQIIANAVGITELNVTDGTAGQVLSTDGSGNLSFTTVASGGGTDVAMAIALG